MTFSVHFTARRPDDTGCDFVVRVADYDEACATLKAWTAHHLEPDTVIVCGIHLVPSLTVPPTGRPS